MSEKIIEVSSNTQFKSDYTRYGIYILYRRVLSDFRDGLKPVQRRILWAMYKNTKAVTSKVKSAAVVGDVMKLYHPHGDAAIYGTMKPMANWFETSIPLIDGEGNWGTFQGDQQAAARYTECKLSKFAIEEVLGDIIESPEAVDWSDTYSAATKEPDYLPVKVPLLLINGSFGIGLGMRAEIPTHNLAEVIDATLILMDNPNAEITLVPDHCMACEIIDTDFAISCNGLFYSTESKYFKQRKWLDAREYLEKQKQLNKSEINNICDQIIQGLNSLAEINTIQG